MSDLVFFWKFLLDKSNTFNIPSRHKGRTHSFAFTSLARPVAGETLGEGVST